MQAMRNRQAPMPMPISELNGILSGLAGQTVTFKGTVRTDGEGAVVPSARFWLDEKDPYGRLRGSIRCSLSDEAMKAYYSNGGSVALIRDGYELSVIGKVSSIRDCIDFEVESYAITRDYQLDGDPAAIRPREEEQASD